MKTKKKYSPEGKSVGTSLSRDRPYLLPFDQKKSQQLNPLEGAIFKTINLS